MPSTQNIEVYRATYLH